MKTIFVTLFAAILLASTVAAQTAATDAEQTRSSSGKPIVVSGKVSADGKMLVTDIDSEWAVSNAALLKGFEGRLVKVKCFIDTEKNRLQVLTVKAEDSASKYAAVHMDSAFHR